MRRIYDDILTETFLTQRYLGEHQSACSIGSELGINEVTVSQYLRRYHIPVRSNKESKHTHVDYAGFDNLSDDWHAYWIGFLAADGCVFVNEKEGHARVQLTMKDSDIEHIRNFQQGIKTTARVTVNANPAGRNSSNKVAKIAVSNPHLVRALAQWGIVPNKTLTLTWPDNIPASLIPAYIRGYFDGDGTVYLRYHSRPTGCFPETNCRFISGSVSFLERIQKELRDRNIKTRAIYRNQKSNAFVLPISSQRENLLSFSDMLYRDCTVYLERKRAIFQEMKTYHTEHPRTGSNIRFATS